MNAIALNFSDFIQVHNNQTVTTSEFIAQAFGKRHADVLRKIDELLTQVPDYFNKRNFAFNEKMVKVGFGERIDRICELTKDGFILLVMGFTGKQAMQIKISYIEAFNAMAEQILNQSSSSLKTQTALPNGLTLEQQDEIKKFHRQLVQAAPKEKQAKLAIQLWSSIKSKFGVSYKEVAPEHYPEVLSLMARVAVENATLTGELLDKPIQSTVRLEEFELIRVMEFLSNRYMEMQTASDVARAIFPLNPRMANDMKSEFERDFPLLKGIAHTFQRFSGSLKDPLCAKEFEMHAKYLQGANLAW